VDHHRHPAASRRQVGRQGDVSAEADHHVGRRLVHHRAGLTDRLAHPPGQPQQVGAEPPGQRHRSDQLQPIAALTDQSGLQTPRRAQRGDRDGGQQLAQRVGDRQRGFHMPGGPATGQHDRQPAGAQDVGIGDDEAVRVPHGAGPGAHPIANLDQAAPHSLDDAVHVVVDSLDQVWHGAP